MKIFAILFASLVLTGCASMDVAKRDQLILEVPQGLMVPPADLKKL